MPSKRDDDARPLIGALAASILLHALALFGERIAFERRDPPPRIILQAVLQRVPGQARVTPDPVPPAVAPAAAPSGARPPAAKPVPGEAAPGRGPAAARPSPSASPSAPPGTGPSAPAPAGPAASRPAPEREALIVADPGAPEYPDDAVRRKLESCVLAAVLVSAGGEVESVRILHADVPGVFDRSVIDAYSRARYLPAQAGGESVSSRVLAVASFVLGPERERRCAGRYAPAARRIAGMPASAPIDAALVESLLHGAR